MKTLFKLKKTELLLPMPDGPAKAETAKIDEKTFKREKVASLFADSKKKRTFAATLRGRAEAARRAHNPEVVGSNPAPATK